MENVWHLYGMVTGTIVISAGDWSQIKVSVKREILTFWQSFVYLLIRVPKYHLLFLTSDIYSFTHSCHSVSRFTFHLFPLHLPSSLDHVLSYSHSHSPTLTFCPCPPNTQGLSRCTTHRKTLDLSVRTHTHTYFSVTAVNRCDFRSLVRWQIQAADEGRAACSSTTLVIASQGTERMDHRSATTCYR